MPVLTRMNYCQSSTIVDGPIPTALRMLTLEGQGFTHPHLWMKPNAGQVCRPSTVVDGVHTVLVLGGSSTIVDVQCRWYGDVEYWWDL